VSLSSSFGAKTSGKDATIGLWCQTGSDATVVGFSGTEDSLLDGTVG